MLKKIAVDQLRLGMHVHKLEAKWMDHSFWKTRFVLDSTDDMRRLQTCGVAECWIDTAQGLDVAGPVEAGGAQQPLAMAANDGADSPSLPPAPSEAAADRSLSAELRQAAEICKRGREAVVAMFSEARLGRSVDPEACMPLVEEITGSVQRNPGALVSLARLKSKDDYSYMHSVAVCALMVSLARQLGLDETMCRQAGLSGLLHDIGKAMMPLDVLNKPGKLTDEEYVVIQGHPVRGYRLLAEGQGVAPEVLDVVLHHHERVDGKGYPDKLQGEQISLLARMGAICDVYDAITSNRPYKVGWDPADSIAKMAAWKGQFDEAIFAAFVQSLGIYPTGSLVRLASSRLAVVVEQNPHNLVAPVVKAFFSMKSQMRMTPQRIDLSDKGCNDRIVGRHADEANTFGRLEELWADPELLRRLHR